MSGVGSGGKWCRNGVGRAGTRAWGGGKGGGEWSLFELLGKEGKEKEGQRQGGEREGGWNIRSGWIDGRGLDGCMGECVPGCLGG